MALSTTRTLLTQTGINTHQVFDIGGLDSVGVATFSNFKTGSTNVHSVGVEAAGINVLGGDTPIGSGSTIYDDGGARFSGVVTATSFHGSVLGDISQATGAAAGLGTALSQTQTDPLNKIYYTDKVLSISTTQTIDHPATANLAYTQYGDIKIEDGHDLIIKDGDDFKYDILGISTTKIPSNEFPSGLSGDLTGNVTGNLTGNVTGNVTGNADTASTASGLSGTPAIVVSSIVSGNILVGTAGNGVDFSVQTSTSATGATTTAEILDHYEEGSWTPVFQNVNTPTYTTQYGIFTRVGRMVLLHGQISVSSIDTSDGSTVNIGGLPFTGNSSAESCLFTFGRYTNLLPEAKLDQFTNARFGGNYVMLHEGNNADISYAELNSSGTIQFSISYMMN